MLPRPFTARSSLSGFSLIEVALALGVFSFAVLGLMGMIPIALQTHKEAKVDTVLAQIKQRLAAEVLLTDGALLSDLGTDAKRFDGEGRELLDGAPETDVVYRAKISLQPFQLPGTSLTSSSLQRVVFYALPDPSGQLIDRAPANGSLLISKAENSADQAN